MHRSYKLITFDVYTALFDYEFQNLSGLLTVL